MALYGLTKINKYAFICHFESEKKDITTFREILKATLEKGL